MPVSPRLPPSRESFLALSVSERMQLAQAIHDPETTLWRGVRIVLSLGRPRTCVPGMLTYALGAGHAGATLTTRSIVQALLCFFGAFIANLENTYTDLEEDCHNLPGRVHLLLTLGTRRLLRVIVGLHVVMLAAAAALDWPNLVFMVLALSIVHQYSFRPLRAKRRPLVGLVVFSAVVAYPFFVGLLSDPHLQLARRLTRAQGFRDADALRFLLMGAVVALWFVAKGMFKNVPDYYGDRAAGLQTSATVFASWAAAATAATATTVAAYAALGALVFFGTEPPRVAFALVVVPAVVWNCVLLIRAEDGFRGNVILKRDMLISVAFMSLLLLLAHPTLLSGVIFTLGALTTILSDLLQVDSRRARDVSVGSATAARGV